MAEFDTCNGCSSKRQGITVPAQRYSFSKKLLVATCITVIITMCLTQTEAASLGHKKHKRQQESRTMLTKETSEIPCEVHVRHKRRHQRDQPNVTKDSLESRTNDPYREEIDKVMRKIRNMIREFNQTKHRVNASKEYRNTKVLVPTTNFTDLLTHSYKHGRANFTFAHRKFKYIVPKLYISLAKYLEIFQILAKVQVVNPDRPFTEYQNERQIFLKQIIRNLQNTLVSIQDKLKCFHIMEPHLNKTRIHLEIFKKNPTVTQCLEYDGTVFRSYGITLNRWFCTISSKKKRTKGQNSSCSKIIRKLKRSRKQQTKKRAAV